VPWIRLVGVLALFNRLDDPRRVPLCVLDLLLCLLVDRAPDIRDVEEGCGRIECCRGLPGTRSAPSPAKRPSSILCHPVGLDDPFRPVQRFLRELLDVCLPRRVVCDGVLGRVLCFCLAGARLAPRRTGP
jgi:hypothetical protein